MIKTVQKPWGREEWIVNNDLYCGKKLIIKQQKGTSFHYHKEKTETFYILSGILAVYHNIVSNLETASVVLLKEGDSFDVPRLHRHKLVGITDVKLIEFSTHHEDSDSIHVHEETK